MPLASSAQSVIPRIDNRLSAANPNSDYSQYLRQQQQQKPQERRFSTPHVMHHSSSPSGQLSRNRRSQGTYSTPLPASSSNDPFATSSRISSSGSSTSSRSSAHEVMSSHEPVRYTLTDNPIRLPPQRQPAHRSKLFKQYTPSESEDSDDEPLAHAVQSRFSPGQPIALNNSTSTSTSTSASTNTNTGTNTSATESLRALSQIDMDQTTSRSSGAGSDSADDVSLRSATKK
ncbi:hypothetical protein BGZ98_003980, partial [Dissophora globulifera]